MTDALRDALHQYEQIGPSKMDRAALNLIRDAASASFLPRFLSDLLECMPMISIDKLKAAIDACDNEVALECMRFVLVAQSAVERGECGVVTNEIELKRIDASLEDVLGDLEKYETRSDAVAEVCRMVDQLWNGAAEAREDAAKVADAWLAIHGDSEIKYTSAREYASDAVKDIADEIRSLSISPRPK